MAETHITRKITLPAWETPETLLQAAAEALTVELKDATKEKRTVNIQGRTLRDEKICGLTIGICILEHAAEYLICGDAWRTND